MEIILASSSPRRKDILAKMGLKFEIIPSDYEEILENADFEYQKIEDFAYNKALCVCKKLEKDSIVIGADTVVVLDGKILGKPQNEADAFLMLKSLSGKVHLVVTSICVINSTTLDKKVCSVTSRVEFEKISEAMILDYIEKFKPLDKAGSYGIQELPEGYIKSVQGSFENIIGLCSAELGSMLREFDIVTI